MVTTESNVVRYGFTPSVSIYTFPFPFLSRSDIKVIATDSGGDDTVLILGTDYTVSYPGDSGAVTLVGDLSGKGWEKLTILREISLTQTTDLDNGQSMDAVTVEASLDRLLMQIQQVAEQVERSMKVSVSDGSTPPEVHIPDEDARKNTFLGFDENGEMTTIPQGNFEELVSQAQSAAAQAMASAGQAAAVNQAIEQTVENLSEDIAAAEDFINANAGKGFRTVIGDGSTKTFTVEHDLGTAQIMVYLWYTGDGTLPFYSVEKNPLTPDQITIDFETAPPIESVEVLISTIRAVERTEDVTPDDMADSTEMSGADVLAILNA